MHMIEYASCYNLDYDRVGNYAFKSLLEAMRYIRIFCASAPSNVSTVTA